MLDDLKLIHSKDLQDALGSAEKQAAQLRLGFEEFSGTISSPENIVVSAMGGSAMGALIAASWPGFTVPFEIVRSYDIPRYVSPKTLFIATSYSGNTEETLTALEQADAKDAQIVVITNGGRLQEIAKEKGFPFVSLPMVSQPRLNVLASFTAILAVLRSIDVLGATDLDSELERAATSLDTSVVSWRPDVPTTKNDAKQIAQEIIGKSVVIYSGPKLYPAAYKWKIDQNENAKHLAWVNQYPEFNHNEFTGWSKQPVDKPYAVIDLRSNLEHKRIQKRFIVSERLLSGVRPSPIVVEAKGETLLEQLVWTIALGDFVSLYLAILNGLNPTPLELVDKFKKELSE
jgi:glucose/mannose-6-phosphate isomerase